MRPISSNKAAHFIAGLVVTTMIAGCMPNPETASIAAAPKTAASKTFTSFTPALRCMDDLLMTYGKRGITITSSGITDATAKVAVGTKEMLLTAINTMSRKSKAFSFVDYDQNNMAFFNEATAAGGGHLPPMFYIRGAITQVDDNALETQAGGAISTPFADLGLSRDQIVSLITMDMNIGETVSRQIISDAGSSNTMAVVRAGRSGEAGGKIGKAGLSLNISLNQSEGMGASVRALVELGLIETIGQWTKIPYWNCLQIEKTNPKMMETARDWFDSMGSEEQVRYMQRKMTAAGYYSGKASGDLDGATRDAISAFQNANGLIANGRINFETYYATLDDSHPIADDTKLKPLSNTKIPVPLQVVSDQGLEPVYQVGSILNAKVDVGSKAFVYCYYKDAINYTVRLFPNKYQNNAYGPARSVLLSSPQSQVKIRFDQAGKEFVMCLASENDVVLPPFLKDKDLVPLSVSSLEEIESYFRKANPSVSVARLNITVK